MEIAALRICGLSVNFGKKRILEKISFSIPRGGLTVLMGMNGSGKTTLLRTICGNLKSWSGEIYIFEKRQKKMNRQELSRTVAYIPQSHTPVFRYNVLDFVLMGAVASKRLYEQPSETEAVQAMEIINQLHIGQLAQTDYSILSGGERQLALIARGMMQKAPIMLLDEPVASLDLINIHRIMKHLKEISLNGTTIFVAMHDPNLALKYADNVIFVHESSVFAALNKDNPDFRLELEETLNTIYKNVKLSRQEHFEVE